MKEETAHHIVCECPAIKSIRVRFYGKQLLLGGKKKKGTYFCEWIA